MLEFCQSPENFSCNTIGKKIFYIVPYFIICHRTFDNIVGMGFSMSACSYKIKPFVRHFGEPLDIEVVVRLIFIYTNNVRVAF